MKNLKKIIRGFALVALTIPLSMGFTSCGDNGNSNLNVSGNATEESPIIGTWNFDYTASTSYIKEVKVEVGKVAITFSDDGIRYWGVEANGANGSSVVVNENDFDAAEDDTERERVYDLHGELNAGGNLVVTGTISDIGGRYSEPVTVSVTSITP